MKKDSEFWAGGPFIVPNIKLPAGGEAVSGARPEAGAAILAYQTAASNSI
jgi:hypothetical protein